MKKLTIIKRTTLALLVAVGLYGVLVPVTPAHALDVYKPCSDLSGAQVDTTVCAGKSDSANSILKTVVNTLLFIVGAIAVIMIIYGGIRYVLSAGNAQAVSAAKSTVLYAVIGLVVAFLAYAIINWVIGALQGKASAS